MLDVARRQAERRSGRQLVVSAVGWSSGRNRGDVPVAGGGGGWWLGATRLVRDQRIEETLAGHRKPGVMRVNKKIPVTAA